MTKVDILVRQPTEPGIYLVETESHVLRTRRRFDARLYISNGKLSWDIRGQTIKFWYDESDSKGN